MAKKSTAKKKYSEIVIKGIANPPSGLPANVRAMMPQMTNGVLCFANGTAIAAELGFTLAMVHCHILAGQDNEEDPADTISQGKLVSSGNNPNWSIRDQLAAFLPSVANPLGWNTLNVAYTYMSNPPMLPPQSRVKSEHVSFKGQFIQQCPAPPAIESDAKKAAKDLPPSRSSGQTYIYKDVPVNELDGVRLLKKDGTPLRAELLAVAATRVDWTPDELSHPRIHRPVGPLDSYLPSGPLSPVCRFRTKPRNSIVLYQDSAAAYAVMADDKRHPDIFEFNNTSLDLIVQVNDLVDIDPSHLAPKNFYLNNAGTFDLWVKVLR